METITKSPFFSRKPNRVRSLSKKEIGMQDPKEPFACIRNQAAFSTMFTISPPMASEAVAAGLGALSTCSALGRATRQKSW